MQVRSLSRSIGNNKPPGSRQKSLHGAGRILAVLLLAGALFGGTKEPKLSALDLYIQEALAAGSMNSSAPAASPGSTYFPGARLADPARDFIASQVNDIVTILVSDRASAINRGTVATSRSSSASAGIGSIAGPKRVAPLQDLARLRGETELSGQGSTSRENVLTTTLSARVSHVLPNGDLVVEGVKEVVVNSEKQLVTVRGVVRPVDLGPSNQVRSDRIAMLEVRVTGKGVVGDAVRRPFILYRLLLGLLPF